MENGMGDDVTSPNRMPEKRVFNWRSLSSILARWVLKTAIWLIFFTWVIVIFLYASPNMEGPFLKYFDLTDKTFYGLTGSMFPLFGSPVLIIAFLAIIYLSAFPKEYHKTNRPKFLRFRLSTFPVLVNGPFGVVTAAELIGILIFAAYLVWAAYGYTAQNRNYISTLSLPSRENSHLLVEYTGYRLGTIGMFCLTFLFLPISRGSVLFRFINVPYEHAAKYHIWLGHLTMSVFTLHSLCYMGSWGVRGHLFQRILRWNKRDVSYFPGLISLLAGLTMWMTSQRPVRRQRFELFYYTHHLYAVFVIFFALHVGDFLFSVTSGAIFLYMLDRFLRFCQSRTTVDVVSARYLPCGVVELALSKPRSMQYNALSFIFLKVREVSQLQWHPFSISSSPLDGRNQLSVLIRATGRWTKNLGDNVLNASEKIQKGLPFEPNSSITASVEGPYGCQSPSYLKYEHLILIAGGIGISPFLAVLREIINRIEKKKPCLPKNVLIVWAVKKSQELSLLSMVDSEFICPSFSDNLHLEIQTFVTQETEPQLEDGNLQITMDRPTSRDTGNNCISSLVATGHNIWSGVYVILPTVGFITLLTLLKLFYIKPYNIITWWYQGLLFLILMIVSIVMFGGLVVLLWRQWERKVSGYEKCRDGNDNSVPTQNKLKPQIKMGQTSILDSTTTQYGCRPNLKAILNSISNRWGNADVGVFVCGPPSLNSSVAAECRSQNIWGRYNQPIFHFNSHSFEL